MVAVIHTTHGAVRSVSLALLLLLYFDPAMSQLRPDYSDLPGKYCETRPKDTRCCGNRADDCGVGILGTVCYCDQFCDRGLSGDCCPDYFSLCLNETQTQAAKDCLYKGNVLPFGAIVMDNCNACACSSSATGPEVVCGSEACLVDPILLAQLNRDAAGLGWSATNHSRFWGRTLRSGLLQLLGTDRPDRLTMARTFPIVKALDELQLPAEFDARRRPDWAGLIGPVQDQGWCGASWALSTAGTASDRLSIQTGGRVTLSAQHLLDCVPESSAARACRGGRLDRAWHHLRWTGVNSAECRRYRSGQTGVPGGCRGGDRAGAAPEECRRRYRMQPSYRIASRERDIRHEIFTSGPVQALLRVEPDLFLYRSGVYRSSRRGRARGAYHSVRIIGWGEEVSERGAALPFWLAVNSWGTDWGEEGLLRIRRGTNEADIETFVVGSWAQTHRLRKASLREETDEERRGGAKSDDEDQGRDPEEGERADGQDGIQTEGIEGSGDDATKHLVAPGDSGIEDLVAFEANKTAAVSEIGNEEHLVTHGEEETESPLSVDQKTEISLSSGADRIELTVTPDEEGKDSVEKPSGLVTGYAATATPKDKLTSDTTSPDDDGTIQPNRDQTKDSVTHKEEEEPETTPIPNGGWLGGWL